MADAIRIEDLRKSFSLLRALNGVGLTVHAGEDRAATFARTR